MCFLIDGYNSLHKIIPKTIIKSRGLEEARREYLQILSPYLRRLHPKKVIVVFDSDSNANSYDYSRQVRVFFAPPPNADEWIKKAVQIDSKYIVVSDDSEIRFAALSAGVPCRSNDQFLTSIGYKRKAQKAVRKTPKNEPERKTRQKFSVKDDAKMFGLSPDDSILLSKKKPSKDEF